jgi:HD-like signal output (HDOD) protein
MSLANDTTISAALRRIERLSGLDEQRLSELAHQVELRYAAPGDCVLELGSEDSRQLFLIEGKLLLIAGDGARHFIRQSDISAEGPVCRLRPSRYHVTAHTAVKYFLVEQTLLETYSEARQGAPVTVEESLPVSEPNELIDDSATHPLMFDVFHDMNHGHLVAPSDPDIGIRVGRSLLALGDRIVPLANALSACPVLTLKVIRAAKAADPRRPLIYSTKQAVQYLGTEETLSFAINCILRESLRTDFEVARERFRDWWRRTLRVSAVNVVLARMSERFDPEYAALIGLLHSIAEPVLLGYADRHPDLSDSNALDNVVHDNRAELGRILLTMWGLPREVVDAAARCNQWGYDSQGEANYTDINLVAQWHAIDGDQPRRRKPPIEEIPAFRRLGLRTVPTELATMIDEAAEQAVEQIDSALIG